MSQINSLHCLLKHLYGKIDIINEVTSRDCITGKRFI